MSKLFTAGSVAILMTLTACGGDMFGRDQPVGAQSTSTSSLRAADFVRRAASSGMAEVQQGQLAAQRAQNPDVRSFASRMVQDHGRTNSMLADLAMRDGYPVPKELDSEQMSMMQRLQAANGREFDRLYVAGQVTAHERAVALFQQQASQGENTALRNFATQNLPDLRQHLDMVRALNRQIGGTS